MDFIETFSTVAKLVTAKVLLAIAASNKWHTIQLDVNNAFLHGDLFEEIYIDPHLGYATQVTVGTSGKQLVCKLHKSIYDLKYASRQWFLKYSDALTLHGLQSKSDYSLFTKDFSNDYVAFFGLF